MRPLYMAAIDCPHSITDNSITLHFDSKQPGHNALNQLALRIEAAASLAAPDCNGEPAKECAYHEKACDYRCMGQNGGECKAAQPERAALNPSELRVSTFCTRIGGGWAPIQDNGVRVLHVPTGISVEISTERSQHRNKAIALERLAKLIGRKAAMQASATLTDERILEIGRQFFRLGHSPDAEPAFVKAVRAVLAAQHE